MPRNIILLDRDQLSGMEVIEPGGTGNQYASQLAMFVYWGVVRRRKAVNSIWSKLHQGSAGTSVSAAEVALCSSPLRPNGAAQTLTFLAAGACTTTDLQAAGPAMFKNTNPLNYTLIPGTYLWMALRIVCTGTLPTVSSIQVGPPSGMYLKLAAAGALTGLSTAAGALPTTVNETMPGLYLSTN